MDAAAVTFRQATGFPDEPATRLTVVSGSARMAVQVQAPGLAGPGQPGPG